MTYIYIYITRLKDIPHKNNNGLWLEQHDITTASLPGLPSTPFLLQSSLMFNTFLIPVVSTRGQPNLHMSKLNLLIPCIHPCQKIDPFCLNNSLLHVED